jgi:hypothetical protein
MEMRTAIRGVVNNQWKQPDLAGKGVYDVLSGHMNAPSLANHKSLLALQGNDRAFHGWLRSNGLDRHAGPRKRSRPRFRRHDSRTRHTRRSRTIDRVVGTALRTTTTGQPEHRGEGTDRQYLLHDISPFGSGKPPISRHGRYQ